MERDTPGAGMQRVKRGLSASQLKTIAIVAMIIDHVAWAFVPSYSALGIAMHFVGRITGPTMFYFIAEGYHHTRNINRYTLRLGVFALLSYLPYFYFENGTLPSLANFSPVGVIYTLFLGLLALRAQHEVHNPLARILLVIGCILASAIGDWGILGVALILIFDIFRGDFKKQCLGAGAVFFFTLLPNFFIGLPAGDWELVAGGIIQLGQFLPLLLLGLYTGQRGSSGPFSKWVFYIIYPLHLLVIGFIRWELLQSPLA